MNHSLFWTFGWSHLPSSPQPISAGPAEMGCLSSNAFTPSLDTIQAHPSTHTPIALFTLISSTPRKSGDSVCTLFYRSSTTFKTSIFTQLNAYASHFHRWLRRQRTRRQSACCCTAAAYLRGLWAVSCENDHVDRPCELMARHGGRQSMMNDRAMPFDSVWLRLFIDLRGSSVAP